MESFEILEHTSDLRIVARGPTPRELFVNMMRGMFAAMKSRPRTNADLTQTDAEKTKVTRPIKVSSPDREALLVDFLNEALYLSDTHQEIYDTVEFTKFSAAELYGTLQGHVREAIWLQVKAATHHGLKIEEHDGMFEATVVLDI